VPLSIVIPAHDEESVVGRCLGALVTGAREGELEVVVACNGCRDRTAEVARAFGGPVRVVETPVASKIAALNLGDRAVTGFPRFYVDADVVLTLDGVRAVAARLAETGRPAASPTMDLDLSRSTWPVRAFYAAWTRLPYVREGMIGVGVYALSEAGRSRFAAFPEVISDDGFVRSLFSAAERLRVEEARVRVVAPSNLAALIRVRTRSRLGLFELARRFPDQFDREHEAKGYLAAFAGFAIRPRLWPSVLVYATVNVAARIRARRQLRDRAAYVWERDASSRTSG